MNRFECRKPIFILGNPRSGTTLFRLILASHSAINIPAESEFIVKLYPKYGHIIQFSHNDLIQLVSDLRDGDCFVNLEEQWQISLDKFIDNIESQVGKSYAEVCSSLYQFYAVDKGLGYKPLWGDKNNAYGNYIDVLSDLYPDAKYIHIVRDGRAVLSSYKKLTVDQNTKYAPNLPKEPALVAERWQDMVSRIDRHLNKYAQGEFIVVKYEDLLHEFESTIQDVCRFLEVPYESSMVSFYETNVLYNLEPENFSWKENTRKPLDRSKASTWQQFLAPEEIYEFEQKASECLIHYTYPLISSASKNKPFSSFTVNAKLRELARKLRRDLIRIRRLLNFIRL